METLAPQTAPMVAIIGRPNVGKSTIFNCFTRSHDALVADIPGLTRDRKYGVSKLGSKPFMLIDTGGLFGNPDSLESLMQQQVKEAIEQADLILFVVDAQTGLTLGDHDIAKTLRSLTNKVLLIANKAEATNPHHLTADFSELAMGEVHAISASHWKGIRPLADEVCRHLPNADWKPTQPDEDIIRIAIIGRPNVGKSTLVNRLLGEERVLAFDMPGTTRDAINVPFSRKDQAYEFIDTAGIRRRSKVNQAIEKFSAIKALNAIEQASVAIVVCDAQEGVTDQDAHLIGLVTQAGRALIIAINKTDHLDQDQKNKLQRDLDLKLPFVSYAKKHNISALHGTGVGKLWPLIHEAHDANFTQLKTADLNQTIMAIIDHHPPPLVKGRRVRIRYAHLGGHNPLTVVLHGNQLNQLPNSYKRYLENALRETFNLYGTPLKLILKSSENPFAGRKNKLNERQLKKRKRLMQFIRKKK